MGKYYNGKHKSIEQTRSLYFSLHSSYSSLHVRVTDIVLCPFPLLLQSNIVLQNSTQRCSLDSPLVGREFSELVSPYHIHGNHGPFDPNILLVCFLCEFCLSFRTLLYQLSAFISHIKCVFQQTNFFIVSTTARLSKWQ